MTEKTNVPKIRFAGFTDPWEQRKLGDVAAVYDGVHQTPDYQDEGVMFLSVENIETLTSQKFISREAFARDYPVYPKRGDVLMTRIGDIGTSNVVETDDKLAFYVSLALLKPLNVDSYYLDKSLQSPSAKMELYRRTLHIAFPKKINKNQIAEVMLPIPRSRQEQEQIGALFRDLDTLITLHQRKHEKLVQLKKSMLDKMFPKPGETEPEIRFAGFTDPWEQRKLGELLLFQNGFNGSSESFGSGVPLISVMDVLDDEFITHETVRSKARLNYEEASRYCVEYGDVLFQRSSENQEDAGTSNVYLDQHVPSAFGGFVIRGKKVDEYNPIFIKYLLGSSFIREQITHRAQGAQHINVSQDTLAGVVLLMPSMREQEAVGLVFLHLANLITLHQRKLELLRNTKKSLLERMFV